MDSLCDEEEPQGLVSTIPRAILWPSPLVIQGRAGTAFFIFGSATSTESAMHDPPAEAKP
jgi:hypothetical protein